MNACYAKLQCCQLKPPPTKFYIIATLKEGIHVRRFVVTTMCLHLMNTGQKLKPKTKKPQQHANILVTFHEHFDDLSKRQKMKRSRLLPNANQEFQETEHYRNLAPRI